MATVGDSFWRRALGQSPPCTRGMTDGQAHGLPETLPPQPDPALGTPTPTPWPWPRLSRPPGPGPDSRPRYDGSLRSMKTKIFPHEFMHNFGTGHAFAAGMTYGDNYDVTGGGVAPDGDVSLASKHRFRWVEDAEVRARSSALARPQTGSHVAPCAMPPHLPLCKRGCADTSVTCCPSAHRFATLAPTVVCAGGAGDARHAPPRHDEAVRCTLHMLRDTMLTWHRDMLMCTQSAPLVGVTVHTVCSRAATM